MAVAIIERLAQLGFIEPNTVNIGVWFTVFEGAASAGLMAQVPANDTTTPTQTQMKRAIGDAIIALAAESGFTIGTVGTNRQVLFQDLTWAPV